MVAHDHEGENEQHDAGERPQNLPVGQRTVTGALGEIKAVDDHQTDRVERGHHGQKHLVSVGGGEADREVGDGVDTDEPADEPQHLAREGASLRQFEPEQHEQ